MPASGRTPRRTPFRGPALLALGALFSLLSCGREVTGPGPGMRLALAVFFAALLAHMWVGLRDVLLDYAQPVRIRPYLLIGLAAGLCGLAVWAGFILLRMPA